MTTSLALVLTVLLMAAVNVWVHVGPRRVHLVTGPLGAVVLLLLARSAGLSWAELGLGRGTLVRGAVTGAVAAGLVAVAYGLAVGLPVTRRALLDTRYRVPAGPALGTAFVVVPLATVVFEEVAFRSVLWGLLAVDHGVVWATAVSSVLFGLWHVLPALDLARTNTVVRGGEARGGEARGGDDRVDDERNRADGNGAGRPDGRRRVLLTVVGTVAFTTLAGLVFAELRRRSGSLLAPTGLHWATNGLGIIASASAWAISRR